MAKLKILFADDSATMRQIMEKAFAAEPVEVVTVPSGEAALAKVVELRPSIVIADAGMPGINGYEICRTLRQDPALSGIPVLIMGGVSVPYDEAKGREAGVTDSMKKPFDTTKLIEKVNDLAAAAPEAAAAPAPVQPPAPALAPAAAPRPVAAPAIPKATPPPPVPPSSPPDPARTPAPPEAPSRPRPVAAAAAPPAKGVKEAMEYVRPSTRQPEPEVKPIELGPEDDDHGAIQVGTLAELAQMDERGGRLDLEAHEHAIDLTPAAPTIERAVVAAGPAAAEVAAKVGGGLTAEQVEAVRSLTAEVVERVVWEVVPDLAEAIIKEHLARLLEE